MRTKKWSAENERKDSTNQFDINNVYCSDNLCSALHRSSVHVHLRREMYAVHVSLHAQNWKYILNCFKNCSFFLLNAVRFSITCVPSSHWRATILGRAVADYLDFKYQMFPWCASFLSFPKHICPALLPISNHKNIFVRCCEICLCNCKPAQ